MTALYDQLTSPQWIATLEGLLGIPNLHFDELGGGLHRILPGGFLAQHLDFNNVNRPGGVQWRRVNILLYLSECGAGGELRMYGATAEDERVVVPPKGNRMVVFECSEQSWHGHPYPMQVSPASDGLSRTTGSSACTCVALSQYYGWAARVTTTHWHPRPLPPPTWQRSRSLGFPPPLRLQCRARRSDAPSRRTTSHTSHPCYLRRHTTPPCGATHLGHHKFSCDTGRPAREWPQIITMPVTQVVRAAPCAY